MKTIEYIGWESLKQLETILQKQRSEKILIVTGSTSYDQSGAASIVTPILAAYDTIHYRLTTSLPNLETVKKGVALARQKNSDTIIGIGGGNVLDTAKSIALLAPQATDDYEGIITKKGSLKKPALPKILIPTTAGTGSESTHFAVIYINNEKYSLTHETILPEYTIIDPSLTASLSPYITAYTGMDALSQAIEAFWSTSATEESKRYSREAIRFILPAITEARTLPTREARKAMLYGAHLAGKAINIAKTTAPHALSYPMTAYFGIPHGHAVAMTLPLFFLYNSQVETYNIQDRRGMNYVKETITELCSLLQVKTPRNGKEKLELLMDELGMERRISRLGIDEKKIDFIISKYNTERMQNNPIKMTDFKTILLQVL